MTNMRHYNMVAYGERVRMFTDHTRSDQSYEVIEEQDKRGEWIEVRRFGHMSDDYALTNARRYAQSLAMKGIGGH